MSSCTSNFESSRAEASAKGYVVTLLLFIVAASVFTIASNLIFNPYGIFATKVFDYGSELNERYAKYHFVQSQPRFDTWLMGSSRSDIIDPAALSEVLPGQRIYNYSFFSAYPSEIAQILEHFESAAPDKLPSSALIGFNYVSFDEYYPERSGAQWDQPYPIEGAHPFYLHIDALTANSWLAIYDVIKNNRSPHIRFDINKGFYQPIEQLTSLKQDPVAHSKQIFAAPYRDRPNPHWKEKEFSALTRIIEVATRKEIDLKFYSYPVHPVFSREYSDQSIEQWHARIEQLLSSSHYTNYLQLSHLGDVPEYWVDSKHFTPELGVQLIAGLYDDCAQKTFFPCLTSH